MKVSKFGSFRSLEFRYSFMNRGKVIRVIYICDIKTRSGGFLSVASINPKLELRRIWKECGRGMMGDDY